MSVHRKNDYLEVNIRGSGAFVRTESMRRLGTADSFAFDCDGTLISTAGSYDRATYETVERVLRELHDMSISTAGHGKDMLMALRMTGHYNNDWDSAFAMILFGSMAIAGLDGRSVTATSREIMDAAKGTALRFTESGQAVDVDAMVEYARRFYLSMGKEGDFIRIVGHMNYPNLPHESRLASLYMELYEQFCDTEYPIIDRATVEALISLSGGKKPAIITGNYSRRVREVLGGVLQLFSEEASLFLGDMETSGSKELALFRKPSPEGILRAKKAMGSTSLLYFGDSGEDQLMAARARRKGADVMFAGVTGHSLDPERFTDYFLEKGADAVLTSVGQAPELISMLRKGDPAPTGLV